MSNSNDASIIQKMLRLPEELGAEFFRRVHHKIIDDSCYWNTLGTLWKLGGTVVQQGLWQELFLSKRPNRHKIMKKSERRAWRKLPAVVTAYRAVNHPGEADTAISWSLDRGIVDRIFSDGGKRPVIEKKFRKDEIFAFFDRRGESEILVNLGGSWKGRC
jgi:hypothetical protein